MGNKIEAMTVMVIPAEGDSPDTEIWYISRLQRYYRKVRHIQVKALIYEHDCQSKGCLNIFTSTIMQVRRFVEEHEQEMEAVEIHAQGGLGAYVAYEFLRYCPERIARVFMIGGAPCDVMTGIAKMFHRVGIRLWYRFRWLVPFFADDPNPDDDETIMQIKASSTAFMREHPKLYRNQLLHIGQWHIPDDWWAPEGCKVYFVPNGATVRPAWWDNTYDNKRAISFWFNHGVLFTNVPRGNFSFYSMMPARELFIVMDQVR